MKRRTGKVDFKKLSIQQLENTLNNILCAYGELYDKAGADRDAMFQILYESHKNRNEGLNE